jgi:hypothetical protein
MLAKTQETINVHGIYLKTKTKALPKVDQQGDFSPKILLKCP